MSVAKTKTLISCAVNAQLVCTFIFAKAEIWIFHAVAQFLLVVIVVLMLCFSTL